MKKVFQIFKEKDLLKRGKPNVNQIAKLSLGKIIDLSSQVDDLLWEGASQTNNIFNFTSSLESSGITGCQGYECKLNCLERLSRFTLMYSDAMYIGSLFTQFRNIEEASDISLFMIQKAFCEQILLMQFLKPLIDSGFMKLYPAPLQICKNCIADILPGDNGVVRLKRCCRELEKEFLTDVPVSAIMKKNVLFCKYPEIEPYSKCKMGTMFLELPKAIQERSTIIKQLKEGKEVKLSRTMTKEIGMPSDFSSRVAVNVLFGFLATRVFNNSFLTEDGSHVRFINSLNCKDNIVRKNYLAEKHLTSIVPFAEEVNLSDLVKLRKEEGDAFVVYRQALGKALSEFKDADDSFKEKNAKELYSDVIEPSIAKMNQRIKTAKRSLLQNTYRPTIGLVGAITFGVMTGLIKPELAPIAGVVGIGSCVPNMIKQIMSLGDAEETIQNEPFYFLWKVKKKAGKR